MNSLNVRVSWEVTPGIIPPFRDLKAECLRKSRGTDQCWTMPAKLIMLEPPRKQSQLTDSNWWGCTKEGGGLPPRTDLVLDSCDEDMECEHTVTLTSWAPIRADAMLGPCKATDMHFRGQEHFEIIIYCKIAWFESSTKAACFKGGFHSQQEVGIVSPQCSGCWEGVLERDSAIFQQLSWYWWHRSLRAHYVDVSVAKFTGICFTQPQKRTWQLSPVLCPTNTSQNTVNRLRFLGEAAVSTHICDWSETCWAWLCIRWGTSDMLQKLGGRGRDCDLQG